MEKSTFLIPAHSRDKEHSYSSYGFDGHWMNRGEFLEMAYKMAVSESESKSNRAFDSGYDALIENQRVSIKSNGATLSYMCGSSIRTNEEREKLLKRFFAKAIFDQLHYVIWLESTNIATVYKLSRDEAKKFFSYAVSWRMSGEESTGNRACYKLKVSFSDAKASKMLEDAMRTGDFIPPKTGKKPVLTNSAIERQKAARKAEIAEHKKAFGKDGKIRNNYQARKLRAQLLDGLR